MTLPNASTRKFIHDHQTDDVRQLALCGSKDSSVDLILALQQIEGRQKACEKLPEWHANDNIVYPKGLALEQCSSSATARYKSQLIHGNTLIDLSGGLGVDTFAFATCFDRCFHVEPQYELSEIALHNANALGLSNITFLQNTMEKALPTLPSADYLYIDPSRRDTYGGRIVTIEECTPNVVEYKNNLLRKALCGLLIKLSPMIDLKRTLRQLPETVAIHVVSVHNECKEVLFLLHPAVTNKELSVTAVNIEKTGTESFSFTQSEELDAIPTFANEVEQYLYEPHAALLKAGAFKLVAVRFNLKKLHASSHLYTSNQLLSDFPGRVFRVDEVVSFNKRNVRLFHGDKANVAIRNFPLTAEELKKKIKVNDGGDVYLFGTTLKGEKKVVIKSRKI